MRRMARSALYSLAAVVVVAGGLVIAGAGWVSHVQLRSVQQVAAPHLGCPLQKIRVVTEQSDIEESYRVEGCGKRGWVRCAPQDPSCVFVEDR
jgi:hypothetical protein